MKYKVETKFDHGDTIYWFADDNITTAKVETIHALLRKDGTSVVVYTVDLPKQKYKKQHIIEEGCAFATPEDVAQYILEKFKNGKQDKVVEETR